MTRPKYLTKSRFQLAIQCPTKLFYTAKDKEYENTKSADEFLQALAEGGYQVGELAKYYHPGGHDIKTLDKDESLAITNQYLEQDSVILYEAAIKFDNFFIRVDVLKKEGNRVELIEVKAKSFASPDELYSVKGYLDSSWRPYLYDVAFQNWVMAQAFPEWEIHPYLMLCDKNKVASVDGLNQLFMVAKNARDRKEVKVTRQIDEARLGEHILSKIDVSSHVQKIWYGSDIDPLKKSFEDQKDFVQRAKEYAHVYESNERYSPAIGPKCKGCEFKNTPESGLKSGFEECWKIAVGEEFDPEQPHIFDIWNFRKSQKLIDRGVYSLEDVYSDGELVKELNERQLLQVQKTCERDWEEDIKPELYNEIDLWEFPLHFIDFETSMVAIPFNSGRHPYEQIAFQYSCHTLYKDGSVKHDEWIQLEPGKFPNYEFVKALKSVLDKDNGTIFRYAAHENTVLRQILDQMNSEDPVEYGDLIAWIDTITEWKDSVSNQKVSGERNMVDILKLVRNYYYHPQMKGSNSIKAVLPAIFSASSYIKGKYNNPVGFGNNLAKQILWVIDDVTGVPANPYKLLPNKFADLDLNQDQLILEDGEIQEGGAATVAFAKMQFTQMDQKERDTIIAALLQYCELDTLAMLMIYEHWIHS
ncbi:MAG: DUF2779 domain-containing protein [Candidatus Marinimicrobia bacterium]|nr:DUF2779 domain-containing protein [Candidatus Neomarinimicrobiota bacterium]